MQITAGNEQHFGSLEKGSVFRFKGILYMKIDPFTIKDFHDKHNAVNLDDNMVGRLTHNDFVAVYPNARLTLNGDK